MVTIRKELPDDIGAIHALNEQAFGQPNEAVLVDALRQNGGLTLSLVAVQNGQVVGHIGFSPVTIEPDPPDCQALGLAPMAVLPDYQNKDIGSKLVRAGLDECRIIGVDLVVVLGHPAYYPRFGFMPSQPHGIRWEHEVPAEAFMVMELRKGALAAVRGTVRFRKEFDTV